MAKTTYKVGDRVIVQNDKKYDSPNLNSYLGKIVTIDRIVDGYYNFKGASYLFWKDCDIAGFAPMLPRKRFPIWTGKKVVLLVADQKCCDNRYHSIPATICSIDETHFVVDLDETHRKTTSFSFRKRDFVCDDLTSEFRLVIYESEKAMEEDQKIVSLQWDIQRMFQKHAGRIPTIEDLKRTIECVIGSAPADKTELSECVD